VTHILVTNDDGVDSPGLLALKRALEPLGKVSVIAPDSNRSAIGRGITIHHPLHVEEVRLEDGSTAFATDGTPVDCVRFGTLGLVEGPPPDIIVSGINLGVNLGDDVTYSGTVAAALEGILLGCPAIAVSAQATDLDADQWDGSAYDYRAAADFTARLVPRVLEGAISARVLLNVNAPGLPPEGVRGARITRLGRRIYRDELVLEATEGLRRRFTIYGKSASYQREEGTDFAAIEAGEISVTPMHFDLTDIDEMGNLERMRVADLLPEGPLTRGA
jgi:5'/3'-nucleotidase